MKRFILASVGVFLFISTVSANSGPWYLFSQGSAPSGDIEQVKHIQVLSEKIQLTVAPGEVAQQNHTASPKSWEYLQTHTLPSDAVERLSSTGRTQMYPRFNSTESTYPALVNDKVKVTYVMKNTSKHSLSIDAAFSLYDNMQLIHQTDGACPDRILVGDEVLPQDFAIFDGKKKLTTKLDFTSKHEKMDCTRADDYTQWVRGHAVEWIVPIHRYTLTFRPGEKKTVVFSYKQVDHGRVLEEMIKKDLTGSWSYDFAPIFSWGNGRIPRVDIIIDAPRNTPLLLNKGDDFRDIYTYDEAEQGRKSVLPTRLSNIGDDRIRYEYIFKNVSKESRMNVLVASYDTGDNYHQLSTLKGEFGNSVTHGLVCVSAKGGVTRFENPFPGGEATEKGQFEGYYIMDAGGWLAISQSIYDGGLTGKLTILPPGTKCERVAK